MHVFQKIANNICIDNVYLTQSLKKDIHFEVSKKGSKHFLKVADIFCFKKEKELTFVY